MLRITEYPFVPSPDPILPYPCVTPGEMYRYSVQHGVPVHVELETEYFDDDGCDDIDPMSDIRTDWDRHNRMELQRMFADSSPSPSSDPTPSPDPTPVSAPTPAPQNEA